MSTFQKVFFICFSKLTPVTVVLPTSFFLILDMLVSRAAIGPRYCDGSATI